MGDWVESKTTNRIRALRTANLLALAVDNGGKLATLDKRINASLISGAANALVQVG